MNRASSLVEAGTSGFLSISDCDRRVSAELEQGSQASSSIEARNSSCLSSCSWGVRPLVEFYLELAAFSGRCKWGVSPLHVVTSSLRLHSKRCPGIRTYLEWTEIIVFLNMAGPTRLPLEFQCDTSVLLRCDGKVGIAFQTKQENRT